MHIGKLLTPYLDYFSDRGSKANVAIHRGRALGQDDVWWRTDQHTLIEYALAFGQNKPCIFNARTYMMIYLLPYQLLWVTRHQYNKKWKKNAIINRLWIWYFRDFCTPNTHLKSNFLILVTTSMLQPIIFFTCTIVCLRDVHGHAYIFVGILNAGVESTQNGVWATCTRGGYLL